MNDRYLCKAKRIDNGEWIEGYLLRDDVTGQYFIHGIGNSVNESCKVGEEGCLSFLAFEVDPSTICCCTGFTDKNGKLIWENDVVCTPYIDPIFGDMVNDTILNDYRWKVCFCNGCFCVENEERKIYLHSFTNGDHVKVIGSAIDNSELLEGEKDAVN